MTDNAARDLPCPNDTKGKMNRMIVGFVLTPST